MRLHHYISRYSLLLFYFVWKINLFCVWGIPILLLLDVVSVKAVSPKHKQEQYLLLLENTGKDKITQKDELIAQTPLPSTIKPNIVPLPKKQGTFLTLPTAQQESKAPLLPPPEELLNPDKSSNSDPVNDNSPAKITVKRFELEGNTAFSDEELVKVLEEFTNRPLSFSELIQVRSAITDFYIKKGYSTSGALIPPQTMSDGVVKIRVIEGELESIYVSGLKRLNSSYIRRRIARATKKPVNVPRLLDSLKLLQSDSLVGKLSAELAAGSRPGQNILDVKVSENDTFGTQFTIDNGRSPSVGSFRRRAQVNQGNLLGWGDKLSVGYTNTNGSNALDLSYAVPINAKNGTLSFAYGTTSSNVIEDPFNELDIISKSSYYELTFRQPLFQNVNKEFNLGITASHSVSKTSLLDVPFPLSAGADNDGRTRISAVTLFQEWTQRDRSHVFALRSQFNLGIGALNASVNDNAPDSRFLSWRGQGQWIKLLAPDTMLMLRGDVQLSDGSLLPTEQFSLGGLGSVRGYRQDFLLSDNGAILSTELRLPILKKSQTLLQVVPFADLGTTWNSAFQAPKNNTLASVGLGLQLVQGNLFSIRLDWGIPLIGVGGEKRSLQENGIYFSITSNPF